MKKIALILSFAISGFSAIRTSAQNVGVDVASPVEKLDVLGAIRIGTTANTNAGTIRWNSPNFQGYDGTQWLNFGGGTLTGSGTATRVAFWNGTSSLSSSANLFWDNTNSRLGVGITNPLGKISAGPSFGDKIMAYDDGTFAVGLGIQPGFLQMYVGNNANNIVFGYGNSASFTENVRITGVGNMGIGTTSPGAKLEVAGQVKITGGTPGANKVLRSDAAGLATWVDASTLTVTETDPQVSSVSNNYIPKWNGTTLVDGVGYDNGTNIGIGTTSPDYKLHVSGSDYLSLKLAAPTSPLLKLSGSYNSGNGAEFWQDATGNLQLNLNSSINAIYMKSTGDVGIGISFPGSPAARLDVNNGASTVPIFLGRDNGTEVFRISDGGNVGIGTTSPGAYLDITGANTGTTSLQLRGGNTQNGMTSNQVTLGYNGTENYRHAIKTRHNSGGTTNNAIDFYVWDFSTNAATDVGTSRVLTIDSRNGGSVGIGFASPQAQLHTTGTVRFAGLSGASETTAVMADVLGNLTTRALSAVAFTGDLASGDGDYIQNQAVGSNFATGQNASFDIQSNAEIGGTLAVNNNVGIGTVTPASPLEIVKGGGNSALFRNTNSNNYSGIRFYNDQNSNVRSLEIDYSGSAYASALMTGGVTGEAASVATTGAFPLQFGTANTLRLIIDGSGNTGIGTSGPTTKLEVNGGAWIRSIPVLGRGATSYNSLGYEARISAATGTPPFIVDEAGTAKFVIDASGRVGIGTSAPSANLDIVNTNTLGRIRVAGSSTGYTQADILLQTNNVSGDTPSGRGTGIYTQNQGSNTTWYFGNPYQTPDMFVINRKTGTAGLLVETADIAGGSVSNLFTVNNAGNVGVGTSAPSAKLDVVGTVEMFGAWTSRSANTVYQATTDGFIIAWAGSAYFTVLTDGSNPPTTTRMEAEGNTGNAARPNIMCPVRKGDYWKVNGASGGTPTVWWMPLGQ